jgi:hypothetical protein
MSRTAPETHTGVAARALAPRAVRRFALALLVVAAALVAGCGSSGDQGSGRRGDEVLVVQAGHQHVHGLGVNAADGDLYIATHNGLWRARAGQIKAKRVGHVQHDLMGFTVVGPDRFLASGHPALHDDLPPQLGLQRSTNGGEDWDTVSLLGAADLHVLRAAGSRVYGVASGTGAFVTSANGGRSWQQRTPPAAVLDLAIAPGDPSRVVAATQTGLLASTDTGLIWRPLRRGLTGLLAWPKGRRAVPRRARRHRLSLDGRRTALSPRRRGPRRARGIRSQRRTRALRGRPRRNGPRLDRWRCPLAYALGAVGADSA